MEPRTYDERIECMKVVFDAWTSNKQYHDMWQDKGMGLDEEEVSAQYSQVATPIFAGIPPDQRDAALKQILAANAKPQTQRLIQRFLIDWHKADLISLKLMCENLIASSDTTHLNEASLESFRYIRQCLNQHCLPSAALVLDYKGVRDILKNILERLRHVPIHITPESSQLIGVIEDMVVEMVSRKNNYLPAYLVVNELHKLSPSGAPPTFASQHRAFTLPKLSVAFAEVFSSFRALAEMVSIIGRPFLTPIAGHRGLTGPSAWRLDPNTCRYISKGLLPYSPEAFSPQTFLLLTLLKQPRGKDLIIQSIFGRNEPRRGSDSRCNLSELVSLCLLEGMCTWESQPPAEEQPGEESLQHSSSNYSPRWLYLSNLFVCSILTHTASLSAILKNLISKIEDVESVLQLYNMLYTGEEETLLSGDDPSCVKKMAPTCLWIHLRANGSQAPIPPSIQTQIKFLEDVYNNKENLMKDQGILTVVCNAYSNDVEKEKTVTRLLLDSLEREAQAPFSLRFLDALTLHAKIVLGTHLKTSVMEGKRKSAAWVESYVRLASITAELDATNKVLIMQLFPSAIGMGNLENLQLICEITSYRLPPASVPVQIKAHFAQHIRLALNTPAVAGHPQLYWTLELTLLRHILWFHSGDYLHFVGRLLQRGPGGPPQTGGPQQQQNPDGQSGPPGSTAGQQDIGFPQDISRVILLCLARAMHISGGSEHHVSSTEALKNRLGLSTCPPSTLRFFPISLSSHFEGQPVPRNLIERQHMDRHLTDEYIKYRTLGDETQLIEHFTRPDASPVFLCLLFRIIKEGQEVPRVAYKILEMLGPQKAVENMEKLMDHLVQQCFNSQQQQHVLNMVTRLVPSFKTRGRLPGSDVPAARTSPKPFVWMDKSGSSSGSGSSSDRSVLGRGEMIEALDKLIWQYWVIPIERLVLTACMAHYHEQEAETAIWIIYWLLQRSEHFNNRIQFIVSNVQAQHWLVDNMTHQLNMYHQAFPQKYWSQTHWVEHEQMYPMLPTYFGNLALSFLPLADLLIQKVIELPKLAEQILPNLLDTLAPLYKYHPQPGLFLSTTLVYYESVLAEAPNQRRLLVMKINKALRDVRPPGWLLTETFRKAYDLDSGERVNFIPREDYFQELLVRLEEGQTDGLGCSTSWAEQDWRFSEFQNAASQAMHGAIVELMSLPQSADSIGSSLIKLLVEHPCGKDKMMRLLNNIALLLAALPQSYHDSLYNAVRDMIAKGELAMPDVGLEEDERTGIGSSQALRLLALTQAFHQHSTLTVIMKLPTFFQHSLLPLVRTEAEFFYAIRIIAPFLYRIYQDRQEVIMKLAVDIYNALLAVDQNSDGKELEREDTICDLLYHLKYMFVGDGIKDSVEQIISRMRPSLAEKLKFISPAVAASSTSSQTQSSHHTGGPPSSTNMITSMLINSNNQQ